MTAHRGKGQAASGVAFSPASQALRGELPPHVHNSVMNKQNYVPYAVSQDARDRIHTLQLWSREGTCRGIVYPYILEFEFRRLGNRYPAPAGTLVSSCPQRNPAGGALRPAVRTPRPARSGMGRVLRRRAAGPALHPLDRTDSHVAISRRVAARPTRRLPRRRTPMPSARTAEHACCAATPKRALASLGQVEGSRRGCVLLYRMQATRSGSRHGDLPPHRPPGQPRQRPQRRRRHGIPLWRTAA